MDTNKKIRKAPVYHITAPYGWMNDPCAPGFNAETQQYQLFYQWNPFGCEWGNMSWGHVTSDDLVHWKYGPEQPVLSPDQAYDHEGVFTGCMVPTSMDGHSQGATIFYSSVCKLPFSWETPPYPRGAAGISVANLVEDGKWEKFQGNPIVKAEPEGLSVTGFRDPFVAQWPALKKARGTSADLFAVVAGGVEDKGPCLFLYEVKMGNITEWDYVGMLIQKPLHWRLDRHWSGDAGVNWECPGFMTLRVGSNERHFVLAGSEGGLDRDHVLAPDMQLQKSPQRNARWCMWMGGDFSVDGGTPEFEPKFAGLLDCGVFYAASTFHDPKSDRQVLWGWIIEEDATIQRCREKGWTGCLALPREIFLLELDNIEGTISSQLERITSFDVESVGSLSTVRTMGIRPIADLQALRGNSVLEAGQVFELEQDTEQHLCSCKNTRWELRVSISLDQQCSRAGVRIVHDRESSLFTEIFFSIKDEEIIVNRPNQAGRRQNFETNNRQERGPHTLLRRQEDGRSRLEALDLRVFRDGQVLEVFANDRFALATMIYIDVEDSKVLDEVSCFVDTKTSAEAKAQCWELSPFIARE